MKKNGSKKKVSNAETRRITLLKVPKGSFVFKYQKKPNGKKTAWDFFTFAFEPSVEKRTKRPATAKKKEEAKAEASA